MTAKRYASGTAREDGRVMGIAPPDHEEQLLAACCVIRHSATTEGAWELFAMLGLDDRPLPVTCPRCGYKRGGQNCRAVCGRAS